MPAESTTIRDAVVSALNAAVAADGAVYPTDGYAFRFGFEAVGRFVVNVNLPEGFTGLAVEVICNEIRTTTGDRNTDLDLVVVDVGIIKRIDRAAASADEFAEVGALVEFVENVRDWLRRNPIDGCPLDPVENVSLVPLYDHKMLSENGIFAAVVRVPIQAQFEN